MTDQRSGPGDAAGPEPAAPDSAPEPAGLTPVPQAGHLVLRAPHDVAAGVPALVATAQHVLRRSGARRGLPLLRDVNQHHGFDCPSCAWPDPSGERSIAEFCENGAKAVSDAGDRHRVTARWLAGFTIEELAAKSDRWLNDAGRLAEPMVKRAGRDRYEAISWDDALAMVGSRLAALDSPDRAVFYTSGRTSNEAAFLYQLFVREYGTNNLPDCSNMCHESSGAALGPTIGIGKGTVLLEDFDHAEVIVVVGQNPGTNHPRMLTALQRAAGRGASIVSINPLREAGLVRFRNPQDFMHPSRWGRAVAGTDLAGTFLPVRIGGDLALLTGVQKALLELDRAGTPAIDHDFIQARTRGGEELVTLLDATDWATIEAEAGVERGRMAELARLLAGTDRIIWCWAMGLTQHEHAVGTIQQITNLALLRGAIGKPGAGLCPVRGHSNVQGDRTVGIWERPPPAFLDRLAGAVGFEPPRRPGLDVVDSIRAMHAGDVDVFVAMGGNFLSAAPDTAYTAEALRRVGLSVQISTKLNRSHLVTGETALLLPCLARTDRDVQATGAQFVSCENSMGIVQRSQGRVAPIDGDLRSEPAIVAGLATATLGARSVVDWAWLVGDYDRVRDLIESAVDGFDSYNARVRARDGFALPNPPREGRFALPGGRAVLTAYPVVPQERVPGTLTMMTIRSHDQFNTTVYGEDDRYRGIHDGRRVVLVNADDAAEHGLAAGDMVDLVSTFRGVERRAARFSVVTYDLPRGCCATYFPEANVLVPVDSVAKGSNTPTSKSVPVRLTRAT